MRRIKTISAEGQMSGVWKGSAGYTVHFTIPSYAGGMQVDVTLSTEQVRELAAKLGLEVK